MTVHVLAEVDGRRICGTCRVKWPCLGKQLHVKGRLEDLRAKYGRELEDQPMPAWLEGSEPAKPVRQPSVPIVHTNGHVPPPESAPKANFADLDV
jgi:hypothetical protein